MVTYDEDIYNAAVKALAGQLVAMSTEDIDGIDPEEIVSMFDDYSVEALNDIQREGKDILKR